MVIASETYVRTVVEASLRHLGLDTRGVGSLGELAAIVRDLPVGGILLELVTSIKSSPEEKEVTNELAHVYPFARFRLVGQDIRILGEGNSLDGFAQRCLHFNPRILRREARNARHVAVYLSRKPGFEDAEKAVTINMSEGGCLVFSSREWEIGDPVWLRFPGDEIAISGTVRFWRAWGHKGAPGIGVQFNVESPSTEPDPHRSCCDSQEGRAATGLSALRRADFPQP